MTSKLVRVSLSGIFMSTSEAHAVEQAKENMKRFLNDNTPLVWELLSASTASRPMGKLVDESGECCPEPSKDPYAD